MTQGQIGQLLGNIDYMSVCQLRKRFKEKMQQDEEIMRKFFEMEALLKGQLSNVRI
jgi:hypothetical protein